jgi:energy-coupling factor transporter ATP-binding protein EcfA2
MKKRFNTTGLCIPERHYMVDISKRVDEIRIMVADGEYFTINRPRQYGKTTTLNCLAQVLRKEHAVIKTSFEGTGDSLFASEEAFCSRIFGRFASNAKFADKDLSERLLRYQNIIHDFDSLSDGITNLIEEIGKGIVLLIDEVDKSSESKIFLQFLGLLRNKYLARAAGDDITFQSVILAGVHDIKNLKIAMRTGRGRRFNSPRYTPNRLKPGSARMTPTNDLLPQIGLGVQWNIAVRFDIDMSFSIPDIVGMLTEYRMDAALDFDVEEIASEIRRLTNGYPYLVSDLCLLVDEKLGKDWSRRGVGAAAKIMLNEKSTLFDDVIKNIENNGEIKATASALLLSGESFSYNPDTFEQGILYGIFVNRNGKLGIHNQLFEERIYAYLLEQQNVRQLAKPLLSVERSQFTETGRLDMELVLRKFREFMHSEYREEDGKFIEKNGRLLFLAYLKPIINGKGCYWVEPETRENKRMDLAVTYADDAFLIELKIWHGKEYEQKGLLQLAGYLAAQSERKGYLVTFGLGQKKDSEPEWIRVEENDIFSVVV